LQAHFFADELCQVFRAAGFESTVVKGGIIMGQSGQFLVVHSTKMSPPCAPAIQNVLKQVGFYFSGWEDASVPTNEVRLAVYDAL
jgi:hypothetical protein